MEERSWTVLPGRAQEPEKQQTEKRQTDRGTFLVKILYRQNQSWQGEVVWAETNERRYFRSALELIRLIDSTAPGEVREGFSEDN